VIDEVLQEASFDARHENRVRQFVPKDLAIYKASERGVGGLSGATLTKEASKERIM
jgi:hypothetical protein